MIKHFSALTILAGVGACSVMLFAPIAGAEDPPPCEQRPPDQQQECQQYPGDGIANQVIDEVTRAWTRSAGYGRGEAGPAD